MFALLLSVAVTVTVISPGRGTSSGAAATTQPCAHAQEHQHHQRRRPSLSPDTRYEQQQEAARHGAACDRDLGSGRLVHVARRTLADISAGRDSGNRQRRGRACPRR